MLNLILNLRRAKYCLQTLSNLKNTETQEHQDVIRNDLIILKLVKSWLQESIFAFYQ